MGALTNLKELDLSKNDFSTGLSDVIGDLTSLETLNLQRCRLSELPSRYNMYAAIVIVVNC